MQSEHLFEGRLSALLLSQDELELTVIPELGGKISSIKWKSEELLARNPRKPLRLARYADPYSLYDASGFDECFPTIGACAYPEYPWKDIQMPDHGEVWSLPWENRNTHEGLVLEASGVRLSYSLQKRIRICSPNCISFDYTLTNLSPFEIKYIWSAHPLFAACPGMRLCLPPGVSVVVDWSKDGRLGDIWTGHSWPLTRDSDGNAVDLSLIVGPDAKLVDKLYTTRLNEGWCALFDPHSGRYTAFVFSPQQIPFVGLSINMGGWPVDEPGYYNIGLEPCCGFPDRLDLAIERGLAAAVSPEHPLEWSMRLYIGTAASPEEMIASLRRFSEEFV